MVLENDSKINHVSFAPIPRKNRLTGTCQVRQNLWKKNFESCLRYFTS